MATKTAEQIVKWLGEDRSDAAVERLARWMRDSLRVGGVTACRELIREAIRVACQHAPARLYSWVAADGTACVACCDCGQPLAGAC